MSNKRGNSTQRSEKVNTTISQDNVSVDSKSVVFDGKLPDKETLLTIDDAGSEYTVNLFSENKKMLSESKSSLGVPIIPIQSAINANEKINSMPTQNSNTS